MWTGWSLMIILWNMSMVLVVWRLDNRKSDTQDLEYPEQCSTLWSFRLFLRPFSSPYSYTEQYDGTSLFLECDHRWHEPPYSVFTLLWVLIIFQHRICLALTCLFSWRLCIRWMAAMVFELWFQRARWWQSRWYFMAPYAGLNCFVRIELSRFVINIFMRDYYF